MATIPWTDIRDRVYIKANDVNQQRFTADQVIAQFNAALAAFASDHTPLAKEASLTADSTTKLFDLPADAIESKPIYGVLYKGAWVWELDMVPGQVFDDMSGFLLWPNAKIEFTFAPTQDVIVFYNAYYPEITGDASDTVDVPVWAREAVITYAAARLLQIQAVQMALLGNFKERRDAGRPTDNPLLEVSQYYMDQYWTILSRHKTPVSMS